MNNFIKLRIAKYKSQVSIFFLECNLNRLYPTKNFKNNLRKCKIKITPKLKMNLIYKINYFLNSAMNADQNQSNKRKNLIAYGKNVVCLICDIFVDKIEKKNG